MISGAKAVFLFEKDAEEVVMGATVGGEVDIKISLANVKISGNAKFESINNETEKSNTLRVKFHGDFIIGNMRRLKNKAACTAHGMAE